MVLNFVKSFFCIYWDYHIVFIFNLLIWCITLINLHILNNPCIPGINPTWFWCMSFLMCHWILLAKIFLRVPRTARRSNQSILKEISLEYSLEGLMLKLKLEYFGHWMWRTDVLEKTLESPLACKEIKPVNSKGNQSWIFSGRTDAEAGRW